LVLSTNDFHRDYNSFKLNGVKFCSEPQEYPWGTSAIFEDLYGNKFDLVGPAVKPEDKGSLEVVRYISHVTLLVHNQDDAKSYFVNTLKWVVISDAVFEGLRWLTIAHSKEPNIPCVVLAKATTDEQKQGVGKQWVGVLDTDDVDAFFKEMENEIEFSLKPTASSYGVDTAFKDLYGNAWNVHQSVKEKEKDLKEKKEAPQESDK